MIRQIDILIIGGGLTGASLLLALAEQGYSIQLVEAHAFSDKITADFDARTLALSHASVRILDQLHVWPLLKKNATPINTIHVSQQKHFGNTVLQNELTTPLGFVVEMQHINAALHQRLNEDIVLAPAKLIALDLEKRLATISKDNQTYQIQAQLIVAADGANSTVRSLAGLKASCKDYHQQAIITNVGLARAHQGIAYERFTASGPLALLPMTENRASLVWTVPSHKIAHYLTSSDNAFLKELQLAFGYRLGRFIKVGKRFAYPLKQISMPKPIAWPLVFVGNAAHTLHPVAGQGFNLGLRDVALLAQCITEQGLTPAMLEEYYSARRLDQAIILRLTDSLIDIFTSKLPGIKVMSGLGLASLGSLSALKKLLIHYTQGFGGVTPNLVCGLPLKKAQLLTKEIIDV